MRLVLLLPALAGSGCLGFRGSPAPGPRLRPTCESLERDTCTAESVAVTVAELGVSDWTVGLLDRRPIPVQCVLRETGVVEACRVLDPRGTQVDDALVEVLERRRYEPPTYAGRPVLVPYTFVASFAPLPAELEAERAVRVGAFRAALRRLRAAPDAGVAGASAQPLVCAGVGVDLADPSPAELEALGRGGIAVQPASACLELLERLGDAARFDAIAVREVTLESLELASVRAELTRAGQAAESIEYRARRTGGRWRLDEVPGSAPPPAPAGSGAVPGVPGASGAPGSNVRAAPVSSAKPPSAPDAGVGPGRAPATPGRAP